MTQKKLIIFDFDGVLVQTADIGYLLHLQANPHLDREYFARFSLGNFLENMNRAIAEDGYIVQENWEDLYREQLLKLEPHDVIRALILDLSTTYRLAIVSSSLSSHIRAYVEQEGIAHCFEHVLGSDVAISKVLKINDLLKHTETPATDAVFITDTLGDVRDGTTCGVDCIGVTWGGGTRPRDTLSREAVRDCGQRI
jgi:phosphoglycolate phosphatase